MNQQRRSGKMKKLCLVLAMVFLLPLFLESLACAQDETIELITYYPAPYGNYEGLTADDLTVNNSLNANTAAITGNLGVGGNTTIAGNATISGNATIPNISGNTAVAGNLTASRLNIDGGQTYLDTRSDNMIFRDKFAPTVGYTLTELAAGGGGGGEIPQARFRTPTPTESYLFFVDSSGTQIGVTSPNLKGADGSAGADGADDAPYPHTRVDGNGNTILWFTSGQSGAKITPPGEINLGSGSAQPPPEVKETSGTLFFSLPLASSEWQSSDVLTIPAGQSFTSHQITGIEPKDGGIAWGAEAKTILINDGKTLRVSARADPRKTSSPYYASVYVSWKATWK